MDESSSQHNEHVYLHEYALVPELVRGLDEYFSFYNHERPHQGLSYQTPAEVHFAGLSCPITAQEFRLFCPFRGLDKILLANYVL